MLSREGPSFYHSPDHKSGADSKILSGRALEIVRGQVTDSDVAQSFDLIAKDYFTHKTEGPTPDDLIVRSKLVELIANHGSLKNGVFVDGCCGTGWLMNAVVKHVNLRNAIGIDISRNMIEIATTDALNDPYKRDLVSYLTGSIANMSHIDNESVTVFGSSNGMDCVVDVMGAFSEINRVLVPNGRLVFSVRSPERNRDYALSGGLEYKEGVGTWYREAWPGTGNESVLRQYLSYSDYIMLLATNGFQVEYQEEPYAGSHVYAIDPDIWRKYNSATGRKSALIISAKKIG